jgi:hypothetical protein
MKLIRSNGASLWVHDVGPPLVTLQMRAMPLKHNGWRMVSDDEAREILRELLASQLYDRTDCDGT